MKTLFLSFFLLIASLTAAATEVKMTKSGGTYEVPVRFNDTVTLAAIVDSGAGEVSIPGDVFQVLARAGTITKEDQLPSSTYRLADGSTKTLKRVNIKKLQVGDLIVYNVSASVDTSSSLLLLGQSFLERLSSWSMDTKRHVFIASGVAPDSTTPAKKSGVGESMSNAKSVWWVKMIGSRFNDKLDVMKVVTDIPCPHKDLVQLGYQFESAQMIPTERLKSNSDAYFIHEGYAQTVTGCWSPKMHKALWHRKQDGYEWVEEGLRVDDTWKKIED